MPRPKRLHPLFHQEAMLAFRMRLRSNSRVGYRNVGLLSIGCAFRPGLRCRLTPGGRTWPGKPWDSGVGDSHPDFRYSCPHNHSQALQRSFRAAFDAAWDALLPRNLRCIHDFGRRLDSRSFSARDLSTGQLLRTV